MGILLDFEEYMRSCKEHLESEKVDTNGNATRYYVEVNKHILEQAKKKILNVIEEGLDNRIISKSEFEAMHPIAKHVGKLYCNFKVHKEHIVNKAPPERPIVSACGSITENIGKFVQHHLDPLAKEHKSYIEDTPDLLRQIEDLNKGEILLPNSILFTCDVIGLFTNITQEDGIEAATEALEERKIKEVPTQFITRLLELVLQYNIFEHDSTLYRQQIGTSMGSKPGPDFSNIFMARRIDIEIRK